MSRGALRRSRFTIYMMLRRDMVVDVPRGGGGGEVNQTMKYTTLPSMFTFSSNEKYLTIHKRYGLLNI